MLRRVLPLARRACAASLVAILTTAWSVGAAVVSGLHAPAGSPHATDGCETRDAVFVHGVRQEPQVALTFDACPTTHAPGFSPEIVDLLVKESVPATFFVSGRWAETHPGELARLAAVSFFEIGSHGYRHHHLNGASTAAIRAEIEDGQQALARLGHAAQPLFRPPFGERPPALAVAARQAGVTPVLWDVAPGDPDPKETAADIERDIVRRARGGSVIVLHVNGRGVGTPEALPRVLAGLRQRGFRFVTVSQLLSACVPGAAP
jgi:peptidoglycan/xylan/chitin deacetylase (PgdA/CDA1 family)